MSKVSVFFLSFLFSIFIISCGDEAASDNDSGLTDSETANDSEQQDETFDNELNDDSSDEILTEPDENVDETADETVDNELNDDLSDEVLTESDETADEIIDEAQSDDDSVTGPSEEALLCCEEIVKEWWRCEGSFVFEAVQGCVDCVNALNTCEEFNPLDESFACKDECGAVCPPLSLKGDGSGTDRRKIADEYCAFIMDPSCGFSADDFSSLGAIDGLDACYDL
ncbi:MAG TPA: hypothetical protein P5044_01225 [bacterium]|nr:hypothetical protein [bacterium]